MGSSNPPVFATAVKLIAVLMLMARMINYIAVQNLVKTLQSDSSMSNRKSVGRMGGASVSEWCFRVQF